MMCLQTVQRPTQKRRMKRNITMLFTYTTCLLLFIKGATSSFSEDGSVQLNENNIIVRIDLKTNIANNAFKALNKMISLHQNLSITCRYTLFGNQDENEDNNRSDYYNQLSTPIGNEIETLKQQLNNFNQIFNLDKVTVDYPDDSFSNIFNSIKANGVLRSNQIIPPLPGAVSSGKRKRRSPNEIQPPIFKSFNSKTMYNVKNIINSYKSIIELNDGTKINYFNDVSVAIDMYNEAVSILNDRNISGNDDYVTICTNALNTLQLSIKSLFSAIRLYSNQMNELIQGKIPADLFTAEAFDQLKIQAKISHSPGIATEDYLSFLQLPYEMYKYGENIHIVLIIPMKAENFKLYRFEDNYPPIRVKSHSYNIKYQPESKYLAISDSSNYMILTDNDLNNCIKIFANYFCNNRVVYKNIDSVPDKCITNLYRRKEDGIFRNCKIKMKRASFSLQKINENTYFLYSGHPIQLKTEFSNLSSTERTFYDGDFLILTDKITSFSTDRFRIRKEKNAFPTSTQVLKSWVAREALSPLGPSYFLDLDLDYLSNKNGNYFDPKLTTPQSYIEAHMTSPIYYLQFLCASIAISFLLIICKGILSCTEQIRYNLAYFNPLNCLEEYDADSEEYSIPEIREEVREQRRANREDRDDAHYIENTHQRVVDYPPLSKCEEQKSAPPYEP